MVPVTTARCYLIGGAPLTGKTKWADVLAAAHAGAVKISTDALCSELMRTTRPRDRPNLFYDQQHDVESFYAEYDTPEKAVHAGVLQGKDIEPSIRDAVARHVRACKVLIRGGGALRPEC